MGRLRRRAAGHWPEPRSVSGPFFSQPGFGPRSPQVSPGSLPYLEVRGLFHSWLNDLVCCRCLGPQRPVVITVGRDRQATRYMEFNVLVVPPLVPYLSALALHLQRDHLFCRRKTRPLFGIPSGILGTLRGERRHPKGLDRAPTSCRGRKMGAGRVDTRM